jgi:hypothetical protein
MPRAGKRTTLAGLSDAFDEVRFGPMRTLDLHRGHPSADDARARVEAWLRQHQAQGTNEVLIITGRGNNSPGGVSPIREAVITLLHSLRRRGVVSSLTEHSAGSFVVALASLATLVDTPRRRREPIAPPAPPSPPTLDALDSESRTLLRDLAYRALEGLGVADTDRFVEAEMLKQFSAIASDVREGPERERRFRDAIRVALSQHE